MPSSRSLLHYQIVNFFNIATAQLYYYLLLPGKLSLIIFFDSLLDIALPTIAIAIVFFHSFLEAIAVSFLLHFQSGLEANKSIKLKFKQRDKRVTTIDCHRKLLRFWVN